jgi:hypothetical protein
MITINIILKNHDGQSNFVVAADINSSERREISTSEALVAIEEPKPGAGTPIRAAVEAACYSGVAYATRYLKRQDISVKIVSASGKCSAGEVEGFAVASTYIVAEYFGRQESIPKEILRKYYVESCSLFHK